MLNIIRVLLSIFQYSRSKRETRWFIWGYALWHCWKKQTTDQSTVSPFSIINKKCLKKRLTESETDPYGWKDEMQGRNKWCSQYWYVAANLKNPVNHCILTYLPFSKQRCIHTEKELKIDYTLLLSSGFNSSCWVTVTRTRFTTLPF